MQGDLSIKVKRQTDGQRDPPRALVSSRTEMTLRRVHVGMGLIWEGSDEARSIPHAGQWAVNTLLHN